MHSRLVLPFFGAQLATSTSGNRRRSNAVPEPDCLANSLWDRQYESFRPLTPRHEGLLSRNALADFSSSPDSQKGRGNAPSIFETKLFFPSRFDKFSICIRVEKKKEEGRRRKKKEMYQAVITRGSDKSRGGRAFCRLIIQEKREGARGFRLLADISKGCCASIDVI